MNTVICGATGIGKTTLSQSGNRFSVLDLEPLAFRWGNASATCQSGLAQQATWPHNYCDQIEKSAGTVDVVLAASYPEVVTELVRRGIEIFLVYPDRSQKEEYRRRYIARGNTQEIVQLLTDHFSSWITRAQFQQGCQHVVLRPGQYLSDVISKIMRR